MWSKIKEHDVVNRLEIKLQLNVQVSIGYILAVKIPFPCSWINESKLKANISTQQGKARNNRLSQAATGDHPVCCRGKLIKKFSLQQQKRRTVHAVLLDGLPRLYFLFY